MSRNTKHSGIHTIVNPHVYDDIKPPKNIPVRSKLNAYFKYFILFSMIVGFVGKQGERGETKISAGQTKL